jgi:hypothetical protein
MADSYDRWLFLLTVAPLPLACTEDLPGGATEGSSTTAAPTTTAVATGDSEGVTSIATTTGVDGTSSEGGETTLAESSSSGAPSSSSSDGTTTSIDPSTSTSTSESSSSTGEQGLCELWGETLSDCYGGYYNPMYYINSCYNELMSIDVTCAPALAMVYQCQASGCFVDCGMEYDVLEQCNDMVLAMELGCDMIPIVPGAGTIAMQCMSVIDQAEVCTAGGYYIPGFSGYILYSPAYTQYFCENGAYFTFLFPPPGVGDACGGAYEELLTCLSGLSCGDFENALFDDTICETQKNALTCRCELEV